MGSLANIFLMSEHIWSNPTCKPTPPQPPTQQKSANLNRSDTNTSLLEESGGREEGLGEKHRNSCPGYCFSFWSECCRGVERSDQSIYLLQTNTDRETGRQSEEMNENLICKAPPCWILFGKYLDNCEDCEDCEATISISTEPDQTNTSLPPGWTHQDWTIGETCRCKFKFRCDVSQFWTNNTKDRLRYFDSIENLHLEMEIRAVAL